MKKTMYCVTLIVTVASMFLINVPLFASDTDDRIESSAMKSYVFKTYLKGDDIQVTSQDGVVTMTGTVNEEYHKSLAKETVASLPGVKSVNNNLEVKGEAPAVSSDARLITKVKATLLFHRSVSASGTEVDVKDGIVTLRGNAENQAQKELTTEYAKDIDGVKDVKNEMIVLNTSQNKPQTTGEVLDDASITAQVKMALLFHRSTSALMTTVETKLGVVTVDGKADNQAEKELVSKLVNDITGVKGVNNRMTIK